MGKTATLAVKITADSRDARRGIQETETAVSDLESRFDRFNGRMESLTVPAASVVGSLVAIGRQAFDAASALEQSTGAMQSVFSAQSAQVAQYAADAAQNLGLAQSDYQQLAAVLGSQLRNMGVPTEQLAGQTNDLITMAADLAATFGGTTADAVSALSALLRGERDPIERYGVSIKAADVEAKKAAMGLGDLEGAADQAATTQATLALLTEQTTAAQGAFAREADTAAGQQQRAAAAYENAKAALGEALLPIVTVAAQRLAELAQWVQANADRITPLIAAVAGAAAAVLAWNAAMKVVSAGQSIAGGIRTVAQTIGRVRDGYMSAAAAQSAFSGAAGTLGGKLRTVTDAFTGGIRAAGTWAATQTRAAATAVASGARTAAAWVASSARTVASLAAQGAALAAQKAAQIAAAAATAVVTAAQWLWNAAMIASPIGLIVLGIAAVIAIIVLLVRNWDTVRETAGRVWASITNAVASAGQAVGGWISNIIGWVSQVPGNISDAFWRGVNWAKTAFTNLRDSVVAGVQNIFDWFAAIPSRIRSAFNSVRIPSWLNRIGGFLGFSAPPGVFTFASSSPAPAAVSFSPRRTGSSDGGVTIIIQGGYVDDDTIGRLRAALNRDARRRGVVAANQVAYK